MWCLDSMSIKAVEVQTMNVGNNQQCELTTAGRHSEQMNHVNGGEVDTEYVDL